MSFSESFLEYSYPIITTLIFLSIYFFFHLKLKKIEKKRLKSIKKREINDAVETESPLKDQSKALKEQGITDIEGRFSFIQKAFPLIILGLWLLVVFIPYLGRMPSVYISIIAAVLSVVAGVSLRPFLENLFSGVVISFFKSVKIGDTVIIDDHYGLIEEVGLTYSIVKRWDWCRVVIPNTKLLQKEIQNLTMTDHYIWAHIEFYVAPDSDLKQVKEIAIEVAQTSSYFNKIEEPSFWVMDLQKDTIKCWLAAWADNPSDAWELRNDMRTSLLLEFQSRGIKFHELNIST